MGKVASAIMNHHNRNNGEDVASALSRQTYASYNAGQTR